MPKGLSEVIYRRRERQWPSEKGYNDKQWSTKNYVKHMNFVSLFHSNAGKNVIYNFS
jgi:hypothetical protein